MRSAMSVRLSVSFVSPLLSLKPTDLELDFCMCMGHDHTLLRIENQDRMSIAVNL